ncbi:MAG: hypothetical protein A2V90_05350 [Gammaproteobacteria bacterium RBG_16_57_12]|nr:MAG: hypothetical protein A2V90_05350 [Gammaproteobacteria bacterium RBG_16_57_12]
MKEFIKNSACFFNFIDDIIGSKDRRLILEKLVEDIRDYLDADRCTLFIVDKQRNELASRVAQGRGEVRLPINKHSLTGCCYLTGRTLRVNDAYNETELKKLDPGIRVSRTWDDATGYKTRNVLVTPIVARGATVGVFLALNKIGGFINYSREGVLEFAPLLGLAIEIVLLDEAILQNKKFEDLPFSA